MLRIRDIDDKKKADAIHEEKMAQTMREKYPKQEEEENKEEELKMQDSKGLPKAAKKNKKEKEIDPEELERQRVEAAYQAELKKYGVSFHLVFAVA